MIRAFSWTGFIACKCQSQALTKRGRAPSKKWSGQNLTGRTVGTGPDDGHGVSLCWSHHV